MPYMSWMRRKSQTAVKLWQQAGTKGLLWPVARPRSLIRKWREEWQWMQVQGCDYVLVPDVNGFAMLVSSLDAGIGRELAIYHVHEPLATHLLPGFVEHGDTILDIGSNIGYYALLFSKLVGEKGLVVGIEPHPVNYHLLGLNLQLNHIANAKLMQVAVSDTVGRAQLFTREASNLHALRPVPEATGSVMVDTVTIDCLARQLERPISAIRMDIEGWEVAALRGGESTLQANRPRLLLELHGGYLGKERTRELLRWLEKLGYERGLVSGRATDFPWEPPLTRNRIWEVTLSNLCADDRGMIGIGSKDLTLTLW